MEFSEDIKQFWRKSQYELFDVNGKIFIEAVNNTEIIYYNPILDGQLILNETETRINSEFKFDESLIDPHIQLANLKYDDPLEVLNFFNKFGLLGLYKMESYVNSTFLFELRESMSHQSLFFSDRIEMKGFYRYREPLWLVQIIIKEYQLLIAEIEEYFSLIDTKNSLKSKKEIEKIETELDSLLNSICLKINSVTQYNGQIAHPNFKTHKPEVTVKYPSLICAIYARVLDEFSRENPIRRCAWKGCRKFFIPKRNDRMTCKHSTCKANFKSDRTRQRRLVKNLAKEHKEISITQIEKIVSDIIQNGISGEKRISNKFNEIINS